MARITVEDCLKRAPNRFLLVNMVAKRVRQIREGSEYLVSSPKNEDVVVALREIAAGKVKLTAGGGEFPLPKVEMAAPAAIAAPQIKAEAVADTAADVKTGADTAAAVAVDAETTAAAETGGNSQTDGSESNKGAAE